MMRGYLAPSSSSFILIVVLLATSCCEQKADAWWLFEQATVPTNAPTTASAAASGLGSIKAEAKFDDLDGVKGVIKFSQKALNEPTQVEYDLQGLKGNNKLYHVHLKPLPAFDAAKVRNNATALAALCSDPATGGHLNPHHVTEKLPPKSGPFDKYETGDLSGKHGPFLEAPNSMGQDRYIGSYMDDKLPMSGENSIVGRSVVIHKNDGKRWVCATINQITTTSY